MNAGGRACSLGYGLVMGDVFSSRGIELKIKCESLLATLSSPSNLRVLHNVPRCHGSSD
jgi:hypothetical protein